MYESLSRTSPIEQHAAGGKHLGTGLKWIYRQREALEWLGGELGPVFVNWVSEVLMPLRFPEADRTPFDDLQEGVTMLAERAKEWTEEWYAQGQRDMAVQMARLKFGDRAAERLSPLLDRIADHAALADVGNGVIQCRDGEELLARTEAAAGSGNDRAKT